jgi:hypothetical protein
VDVMEETSFTTLLSILLGIGFGALALGKILALPPLRGRARELGFSTSAFRIVGALELAGTAGLLTGPLRPPIGYVAAAGLLMLLVGAVIAQRRARLAAVEFVPALVFGAGTIAYLWMLAAT